MLENGYKRGTPVDLIYCTTVVYADGAAYELSRYLKAPVLAPTNLVCVTESGGYVVIDSGRMKLFNLTKNK